jgi:hypothetical protein
MRTKRKEAKNQSVFRSSAWKGSETDPFSVHFASKQIFVGKPAQAYHHPSPANMDRNIYLSNSNFRIASSRRATKAVETVGPEKRQTK